MRKKIISQSVRGIIALKILFTVRIIITVKTAKTKKGEKKTYVNARQCLSKAWKSVKIAD
jgi:hypothetical protein